jgi:RNA polymerase sigma-70 factor (ECF subfamily)
MTKAQEIELVKKISRGNRQAENDLFTHFIEQIAWIVRTKLGSPHEDWKDVVSDTIIAALVNLRQGKFNVNRGNLGSYIYGITRNKIRDYFKNKKKQDEKKIRIDELSEIDMIKKEDDSELDRKIIHEKALDIINELPTKYGQVLKLMHYEGLSVKQISQRLDITPEEVSKRLWYGKQLIKKNYKIDDFI